MPKENELYRDKSKEDEDDDDYIFLEQNLQPIAQEYLYNLRNGIKVKKGDMDSNKDKADGKNEE